MTFYRLVLISGICLSFGVSAESTYKVAKALDGNAGLQGQVANRLGHPGWGVGKATVDNTKCKSSSGDSKGSGFGGLFKTGGFGGFGNSSSGVGISMGTTIKCDKSELDFEMTPLPNAEVCLFQDRNYGGSKVCSGAGSKSFGGDYMNDRGSSLIVPHGLKTTLYKDSQYRGRADSFSQSVTQLSYNDEYSSMKVFLVKIPNGKITWGKIKDLF